MKIKLINTALNYYRMRKCLYIVYATYNYLGETFYCVKTRKYNYDPRIEKPKYSYIEKKTGTRIIMPSGKRDKILTRKEFVNVIRKKVKGSRRCGYANSLKEVVNNNLKKMESYRTSYLVERVKL